MRDELDNKLQARYNWLKRPELKREKKYEFVQGFTTYQNWGFSEVSDGWYDLIFRLCEEIEEVYKRENQPVDLVLLQVKSKFGRLCWYYNRPGHEQPIHAIDSMMGGGIRLYLRGEQGSLDKSLAEVVRKYEQLSKTTCEHCAVTEDVELRTEKPYFRWVETLCLDCMNKKIELYNKHMEEREQQYKKDFMD